MLVPLSSRRALTTTVESEGEGNASSPLDRARFRADIEGLRAIAVVGVLLWHAGVTWVPGGFVGVDVFFVISGYLMTNLLARELQHGGHISFGGFYARRAKRLLPAAAFTLTSVAVLSLLMLPRIRWEETAKDIVASGLYVINWRLADDSVDYLAAHAAPSPVQHFWSLAVEEQFYIVWPLVLGLIGLLAHRRASMRGPMILGLVMIAVPSFGWSVYSTAAAPERAYFVTTTRLWELAVGGLVALLAATFLRILRNSVAVVIGWAGLLAIGATLLLLHVSTPFPGSVAAIPVLGTAAVIAVGPSAGARGPVAVLRAPVMQLLGKLSYSLYLWHWPVLVFAGALFLDRSETLDPLWGVVAVCLSVVPAWLSFQLVEEPVRRRTGPRPQMRRWALRLGAACTALSVTAGVGLYAASAVADRQSVRETDEPFGAQVLPDPAHDAEEGRAVADPGAFTPSIATVRDDVPTVYADGCHVLDNASPVAKGCTYGAPQADFTVAVIGDSHAAQWVPTFQELAKSQQWRVLAFTKSGCPLADETVTLGKDQRPYTACDGWNRDVTAKLLEARPDVVVASATSYLVSDRADVLGQQASDEAMVAGMRRSWRRLTADGIRVIALADTPRPGFDMADCVSANETSMLECAVDRSTAFAAAGTTVSEAARGQSGVTLVDLGDAICPADPCAPVIGHTLVYRDTDHLTGTYARSLAERMRSALAAVSAQP